MKVGGVLFLAAAAVVAVLDDFENYERERCPCWTNGQSWRWGSVGEAGPFPTKEKCCEHWRDWTALQR